MMFQWTPDMVRFMKTASEYGIYHRALANLIWPDLTPEARVADVGCGLGYLSLALAPYAGRVTAMDVSAEALRVLEENCRERSVQNLEIFQGDVFRLEPEWQFDCMAFCFFGNIEEILTIARRHCCGKAFLFQRNYRLHRFSTDSCGRERGGYPDSCRWLGELGIPYERQELSLEFGQPFADFGDAKLFFETYNRGDRPVSDRFVRERIVKTGREDFPFYLPCKREIGFLTLNAEDIPKS